MDLIQAYIDDRWQPCELRHVLSDNRAIVMLDGECRIAKEWGLLW